MCHIHSLDTGQKIIIRDQMLTLALFVGGKNALLKILELIRHTSPHPLVSKTPILRFPKGRIVWNKNIHRDNLTLLSSQMGVRTLEDQNLMAPKEHKSHKNVSNMLRAIGNLAVTIIINGEDEGSGFQISAFEMPNSETTLMNPLFEVLFFCPVNIVKKILNFEEREINEDKSV